MLKSKKLIIALASLVAIIVLIIFGVNLYVDKKEKEWIEYVDSQYKEYLEAFPEMLKTVKIEMALYKSALAYFKETPHDKLKLALIDFDYGEFLKKTGLDPAILFLVMEFTEKADVIGAFEFLIWQTEILEKELAEYLEKERVYERHETELVFWHFENSIDMRYREFKFHNYLLLILLELGHNPYVKHE